MIKWCCNFNIPNVSIQLPTAIVKIVDISDNEYGSSVLVHVLDESEVNLICKFTHTFDRHFTNETEIYEQLIAEYQPGVLI